MENVFLVIIQAIKKTFRRSVFSIQLRNGFKLILKINDNVSGIL